MPENPAETVADPVAAALAARTDLRPGAAEQLATLFADLRELPPGVARDLVRLRLQDSTYSHFLNTAAVRELPMGDQLLAAAVHFKSQADATGAPKYPLVMRPPAK